MSKEEKQQYIDDCVKAILPAIICNEVYKGVVDEMMQLSDLTVHECFAMIAHTQAEAMYKVREGRKDGSK